MSRRIDVVHSALVRYELEQRVTDLLITLLVKEGLLDRPKPGFLGNASEKYGERNWRFK